MGTSAEYHASVVIVGGGPVGIGLAIDLGTRGIDCIAVERHHDPQPIPKGQNLTQRTLEHFYFWGAERQLRAARTIPREYGIGGISCFRQRAVAIHLERDLTRTRTLECRAHYSDHPIASRLGIQLEALGA